MSHPSHTAVLDRLLDPLDRIFTPEVARQIVALRADAATQKYERRPIKMGLYF